MNEDTQADSVGDVVRRLASSTPGIREEPEAGGVRFTLSGRPFLIVRGATVAFRLRKDVARAGLTTAGTSVSREGSEWIELGADRRDRFSRDRAHAWFEFAIRMAEG